MGNYIKQKELKKTLLNLDYHYLGINHMLYIGAEEK